MNNLSSRATLLNIINNPSNKKELELVDALKVVGPQAVMHILNNVDAVTPKQISDYGVANFNNLDFRPNPTDRLVSVHEIIETLEKSFSMAEQTILVAIWLRFDEIRLCHEDFTGIEAAFDNQLSFNDFQKFGSVTN